MVDLVGLLDFYWFLIRVRVEVSNISSSYRRLARSVSGRRCGRFSGWSWKPRRARGTGGASIHGMVDSIADCRFNKSS